MDRPSPFLAQGHRPTAEQLSPAYTPSSASPIRETPSKKQSLLARLGRSVFGHRSSQRKRGEPSAERREQWIIVGPSRNGVHYDGPVDSMTYQQAAGRLAEEDSEEFNFQPPWERTWGRNLPLETFVYEQIAKHKHIAADVAKLTMNDQEYCHYMKKEHSASRMMGRKSRLDHAVEASPEDKQALNQKIMFDREALNQGATFHRVPGQSDTELDDTWGWYRPTIVPERQGRGFNYYSQH
ncbi:MAG: hypothetical protein LQ350_005163 [Teloschistes chrysophthalmus]|nr:MAG: hypothetical protein LQ350_005163 [Niorma chrysophthalma]